MSSVRGHGHFHGEAADNHESGSTLTERNHHLDELLEKHPHLSGMNMTEHHDVDRMAEGTGTAEPSMQENHHHDHETTHNIGEDVNPDHNSENHHENEDGNEHGQHDVVSDMPEYEPERLEDHALDHSMNDTNHKSRPEMAHDAGEMAHEEREHEGEHGDNQEDGAEHEEHQLEDEHEEPKEHHEDHHDQGHHPDTYGGPDHAEHGNGDRKRLVCQFDDVAANHYFYSYVKTPVDITIYCFIPFVILLVTNSLIIHAVIRSKRFQETTKIKSNDDKNKRDEDISKMIGMLLSTCVMFILTTLPNGIYLSLPSVPHEVSSRNFSLYVSSIQNLE